MEVESNMARRTGSDTSIFIKNK